MRACVATITILTCQLLTQCAIAQEQYPTKPIRIIVPYPPGGINDFAARSIATDLSTALKAPIVIDNRGGAGGIVGTKLAAEASPDGYTLCVTGSGAVVMKQVLYKKPPYTLRDFAPVVNIVETPYVVVVHPSLPVRSIKQLIAFAKAAREPMKYASSGIGSQDFGAAEMFAMLTGVRFLHVPYKGAGPAMIDVVSGHVPLMFASAPSIMSQVASGKLRALAVTNPKRSQSLPDLPTIAEEGVTGYGVTAWAGMFAPAGTPAAIVTRLANEINKILQMPAVKAHLFAQGGEPVGGTPAAFTAFVADEIKIWGKVIQSAGIVLDN